MKTRLVHSAHGQRTFVLVLDTGDDPIACLTEFSREEGLGAAQIAGIGAFSEAVLLYFDWEAKEYRDIPVDEQVEVASLAGDIGTDASSAPAIHVHLVLGRRDGSALAGHLKSARVRPTLELVVTESPAHLVRRRDEETGLNLIAL